MALTAKYAISLGALAAGLMLAAPAAAQDQAAETQAVSENEIIVTATRRDQNLQDVPAAVTAFTSASIENAGIERPGEFINLTSNVNLVETQNSGNAFIIIRGITQARNSEPSVAVVIDGVQQVNPAMFNQELVDVEQIEVLKGPQGGLYGRNAIGGAIIIKSKAPTDVLSGSLKGGIDNGFGWNVRAGVSGPLGDSAKFRLSGSYRDTNGYLRNTFLNEDADPVKDWSIRGNVLFDASDRLTVDLRASFARLETQALYFNIVNDVNDTSLPIRVNNRGQNDRDIVNVAAKVAYESDAFTVTSVTSYDSVKEVLTGDAFDFLPIQQSFFFNLFEGIFGAGNGFDLNQSQYLNVKALSQELRIESPADNDLFWMFGGYMIDTNRFISTGNMIDTNNGAFPVYRTPSTNPLNPQFSFLSDKQDNFAWALFGNVGYELNEQLRVDASLRYDKDRRVNTTLTPTSYLPNVPGFPQGSTGQKRRAIFDDLQPKFTLTYEPSDNVTLYGGYSRGFRSGGFNQTGVGGVASANGIVGVSDLFKDETASTFEAGFKSRMLDRKLTLNGAVYSTISKNSYFFVFLAANSTQNLGNIPETRLQGFELEATLRPSRDLQLSAAMGYTWSDIKEFPDASVVGNEAPLISRYTYNLGAQYTPRLTDSVEGLLRLDYRRTGKTWWEPYNTTVRNPVDLVDARVGVSFDSWTITGFAENLFNEKYNAEFSPGGFVFKARPRRYGVEASLKF